MCNEEGLPQWPDNVYLGVYDGHYGTRAADHLVETLCEEVAKALPPPPPGASPAEVARALEEALRRGYVSADRKFVDLALAELAKAAPLDAVAARLAGRL